VRMDNGYQVGYLDDGEFVEVGRFNNLDAVANSDLEIRHAESETRVVLNDDGFDFDSNDATGISALEAEETITERSSTFAYPDRTTIPHATETKIPLDNVEFDQLDAVDQQNDKIILPTDGTYQISAVGSLRDDVDEEFDVRIKRNGSSEVIGRPLFSGGFTVPSFSLWPTQSREIEGLEGDEIELFVTQANSEETDAELHGGARDRTAIRVRRV